MQVRSADVRRRNADDGVSGLLDLRIGNFLDADVAFPLPGDCSYDRQSWLIAATSLPTCSGGQERAMSAWLTMPTNAVPSMTGSRRTLCSDMVRIASSTESSAPIVTASPWTSSMS